MSAKKIGYRRLIRRRGASIASTQGLWMAEDHLLLATLIGVHEEYRRVFFRDIQAMVWHPTRRRRYIDLLIGVVVLPLVMVLIAALIEHSTTGIISFSVLLGLILIAAIVNLAKGPSCSFYIQTATGTAHIACVTRLHRALRLIRLIGEQATLRQGELAPEAWAVEPQPVPVVPVARVARRLAPPPLVTPVVTEPMIRLQRIAFSLVLLFALPSIIMIFTNSIWLVIVRGILKFCALLGCIGGLVQARRLPLGVRLVRVHAGVLVYLMLVGIAAYLLLIVSSAIDGAQHAGTARQINQWSVLLKIASHCGLDSAAWLILFAGMAAIEVAIGCVGFGVLNELRGKWAALATHATTTPPPPPPPAAVSSVPATPSVPPPVPGDPA
jgi:hypothetical protein